MASTEVDICIQELRDRVEQLENRLNSLLATAQFKWFTNGNYTTPPVNMTKCAACGLFYPFASVHSCPTTFTVPPNGITTGQFLQNV